MKRPNSTFLYAAVTAFLILTIAAAGFSETVSPETTAEAQLSGITKDIPDNWWTGGWDKLKELQSFISKYPDKPALCAQAQHRIGSYYQSVGNFTSAIKAYNKVISTYPDVQTECVRAQYEIAQIYFYCLEDYNTAIKEYQKVISHYSDDNLKAVCQLMIGRAYMKLNNYPQAEASFKKVISDYPKENYNKYEAYMDLGSLLTSQYLDSPDSKQKISYAISCYKKAYLYDPSNISIIERICDNLVRLDMSTARATQFINYQKCGPPGQDGVLGTKDDLVNPLDGF